MKKRMISKNTWRNSKQDSKQMRREAKKGKKTETSHGGPIQEAHGNVERSMEIEEQMEAVHIKGGTTT